MSAVSSPHFARYKGRLQMKITLHLFHNGHYVHTELPSYCKGVATGNHAGEHSGRYPVESIEIAEVSQYSGEMNIFATPSKDDLTISKMNSEMVSTSAPIAEPAPQPVCTTEEGPAF